MRSRGQGQAPAFCQAESALRCRLAELDDERTADAARGSDAVGRDMPQARALLDRVVKVMSAWTGARMEAEVRRQAMLDAERADSLTSTSQVLAEIETFAASLVVGPIDTARQVWTTTGMSRWSGCAPSEERFVVPSQRHLAAVQPHQFGLWTSTAAVAGVSMWREYLEPSRHMGGLPGPWLTWVLRVDEKANAFEVGSMAAWVRLACEYPRICGEWLYPDWAKMAQEYDAVHVMLPAVVATQGFYVATPRGVLPPVFWDVECTLWLKWVFVGADLVKEERHRP